jgi:hypothetical protein
MHATRLALAAAVTLAAAAAAPARAAAQERPSEEELFGAPPAERAPERPAAPAAKPEQEGAKAPSEDGAQRPDEAAMFGSTGAPSSTPPPPEGLISREREDPLKLGGLAYLRLQGVLPEDVALRNAPLASPNLLDVFLDARPNDRVRAFVLGRLFYDAISAEPALGSPPATVPPLLSQFVRVPPANPRAVLDQLWINFDVGRAAFVTAGRQHVKWGVGRFWNPTDFLHRQPRDPLDPFDVRTGTAMVKVHVPWERRGWNVYGVALLEDPRVGAGAATGTVRGVPVGGRLEAVVGTAEVGLDLLAGAGARPRYGLDVSAGLWELDLRGELALGAAIPRWRVVDPSAPEIAEVGKGRYALATPTGPSPQVVLGAEWSRRYSDEDLFTIGAEYFFQDAGYDDPSVYPFLAFGAPASTLPLTDPAAILFRQDPAAFTAFRLGRHYAGLFAVLPAPGAWNDTTFTLSLLGNLSDKSFIARLDHSVLALTYLRVETYVAAHLGESGGELKFGLALPPPLDALNFPAPAVDFGVALRVSL